MADSGLVDRNGRPVRSAFASPRERLEAAGIEFEQGGAMRVPPEVLARIKADRQREASISRMPSTPRMVVRDAGGVAVTKGLGQFSSFTFDQLRMIRKNSPLLKVIHAARRHQIRRLAVRWPGKRGAVGWRVVHKDHQDYRATPPKGFGRYIDAFDDVLSRPAPGYKVHNAGDLLAPLWEDFACINRPSVEIIRAVYDPNRIVGFRPIDGGLIFETFRWMELWCRDNPGWFQGYDKGELVAGGAWRALEVISEKVGHDISRAEYCLVREGMLEAVFEDRDIIVAPIQSSTDVREAGYPPSYVEDAIDIVMAHLNAHEFNTRHFTTGSMTEAVLGVSGDIHEDDIAAFADQLGEATKGVRRAHTIPIMPLPVDGTIQMINLKANNKDMLFEGWMSLLIALCTATYRMDPSTINAKGWDGGRSGGLGEPSQDKKIDLAQEEGLHGDFEHLRDGILNRMAASCHPDLMVIQEYGTIDLQQEGSAFETSARVYRTRNEIRLEAGLAPIGFWVAPEKVEDLSDKEREKYDANPWNLTTDSVMSSAMQMAAQAKQQEAQQQGQPDDGFGEPPPDQPWGAPPQPGAAGQPPPPGPPDGAQAPPPAPMQKARRRTIYVDEIG